MKKFLLIAAALIPLMAFSCSKNESQKLPAPVGKDDFAGKTFCEKSSQIQLKFGDDKSVLISTMDYENPGEPKMLDECVADYSYNGEEKKLYFAPKKLYANGRPTNSLKDFVNEKMKSMDKDMAELLGNGTMVMDGESKKNYAQLIKKSYESYGRARLESTMDFVYEINDDGREIYIKELPPNLPNALDIAGMDDSNLFYITMFGNEIVFTEKTDETDGPLVDATPDSVGQTTYYAFVKWNRGLTEFNGTVYSVLITESLDQNYVQTIVCKNEGAISGTLDFSLETGQPIPCYFANFDFTKVPECLKNLKKASLADTVAVQINGFVLAD